MRVLPGIALLGAVLMTPFGVYDARARGGDGRFESRRSTHFLLLQDVAIDRRTGPSGSRRFERDVLAVLEIGYDELDDLLGLRPRRQLQISVYDPELFDARYARLAPFRIAGFYGGTIRVRGDVQVTPALVRTLHHELVHAAFDAVAPGLVLPGWLNEGLAEWFSARTGGRAPIDGRDFAALAQLGAQGALPPIAALSSPSFAGLDAGSAPLAYLQARALVDHLARHRGDRALRELVARLLRTGDLDRSLERVAGFDSAGLEASLLDELGVAR
jgi:hypothetical protein